MGDPSAFCRTHEFSIQSYLLLLWMLVTQHSPSCFICRSEWMMLLSEPGKGERRMCAVFGVYVSIQIRAFKPEPMKTVLRVRAFKEVIKSRRSCPCQWDYCACNWSHKFSPPLDLLYQVTTKQHSVFLEEISLHQTQFSLVPGAPRLDSITMNTFMFVTYYLVSGSLLQQHKWMKTEDL